MRQLIQESILSLALGTATVAFAQLEYAPSPRVPLTSVGYGLQADSSGGRPAGGFTNQQGEIKWRPRPLCSQDSTLAYTRPKPGPGGEAEPNAPARLSELRLAGPDRKRPAAGWSVGLEGLLNYTARNQRWHLSFRYEPDFSTILGDFDHLYSFSLIWQLSLGKRKPVNWADVAFPNMRPSRLASEPLAGARPF
jgi:hypothetical protein